MPGVEQAGVLGVLLLALDAGYRGVGEGFLVFGWDIALSVYLVSGVWCLVSGVWCLCCVYFASLCFCLSFLFLLCVLCVCLVCALCFVLCVCCACALCAALCAFCVCF